MTSQAPAGWYPDPSGAPGQRWWDGAAWSTSVSPAVPQPVESAHVPDSRFGGTTLPATTAGSPSPYVYPGAQQGMPAGAGSGNRFALITFGVVALYIVIAMETRVVIFGFLPLMFSLRSRRQREPLAPLAIGAAVLAIAVAAIRIFG